MSNNVAVGSVLMFAGDLSNSDTKAAVIAAGWLPCDGTSYLQSDYKELFGKIGTAHGGDANNFNVPNMTNRFPRGRTGRGDRPVDPEADTRMSAAAGGATGNAIGSLQLSATALPRNRWTLAPVGDHFQPIQI